MDTINLQYTVINNLLPDFIFQDLKTFSANSNKYQPQPKELIEKIAKKHSVPEEMIFLTAGIDEAIQIFAKSFGKNAYVFTPTYVVYTDVEEFGGKLTRLPSIVESEYKISTETIPHASLIYLANPNNPSGVTSKENVISLVKNNPQAKVVIDEAYGEFSNLSVISEIKNYPHMTVFKSFSKDYGMAGNRIGFIISHPETINVVRNKTQWANISYLSIGAAISALNHEDYFKSMRDDINSRRDDLMNHFRIKGFTLIPSNINALLFKFNSEKKGTDFFNFLLKNNITTSHGNGKSNIGLDNSFIRIAIGTEQQMTILKQVVNQFLQL